MLRVCTLAALLTAALFALAPEVRSDVKKADVLTVIVMDPLAADLSCPCVEGYAQRKYDKLAAHIEKQIGRPVKVHFAESLTDALKKKSEGKADLIIGKHSVVLAQSKQNEIGVTQVAALTGKDGKTTQTGLIVVAGKDAALTPADLKGYEFVFGTLDCEEKHGAALKLLKDTGIAVPAKPETCISCSEGALKVIEMHKKGKKGATVISSYAEPLLEGCGTIKKGDLRVVGVTDEVPFIAAFVNNKMDTKDREALAKALLEVGKNADLCKVMETKTGFVDPTVKKKN